eukprot:TRINITY_DN4479_c0_g1_i8.p1 TRINITY_DN4479_c0_g1~~TRINITY_DN4479_c0_g1_i8.p1  ORF type:complete len:101 (+),score=2.28 TRINITY_DN4479_c0_g1_i8:213-515(+)
MNCPWMLQEKVMYTFSWFLPWFIKFSDTHSVLLDISPLLFLFSTCPFSFLASSVKRSYFVVGLDWSTLVFCRFHPKYVFVITVGSMRGLDISVSLNRYMG